MGIVNRRNAVLGWGVWQVGKRVAKRKAKDAVPSGRTAGVSAAAMAAAGAFVGAFLFWRRRRGEEDEAGGE
jgi:hypothetical protein